jgi:hypothetical protein
LIQIKQTTERDARPTPGGHRAMKSVEELRAKLAFGQNRR